MTTFYQEFSVLRWPLITELGQPGRSVHGVVSALCGHFPKVLPRTLQIILKMVNGSLRSVGDSQNIMKVRKLNS